MSLLRGWESQRTRAPTPPSPACRATCSGPGSQGRCRRNCVRAIFSLAPGGIKLRTPTAPRMEPRGPDEARQSSPHIGVLSFVTSSVQQAGSSLEGLPARQPVDPQATHLCQPGTPSYITSPQPAKRMISQRLT